MHSASSAGVKKTPAMVSLTCDAALLTYSNGAALPSGGVALRPFVTSPRSNRGFCAGIEDATDASKADAARAALFLAAASAIVSIGFGMPALLKLAVRWRFSIAKSLRAARRDIAPTMPYSRAAARLASCLALVGQT